MTIEGLGEYFAFEFEVSLIFDVVDKSLPLHFVFSTHLILVSFV